MVVIPEVPDEMLVLHQLPLNSEQHAARIEAEANQLIGQALMLLSSARSSALWLMQEHSSRLAIAGTWERTWLEFSMTVSAVRNIAAQLRTLSYSSGLSSKILTKGAAEARDLHDWLNELLYPYEDAARRIPR